MRAPTATDLDEVTPVHAPCDLFPERPMRDQKKRHEGELTASVADGRAELLLSSSTQLVLRELLAVAEKGRVGEDRIRAAAAAIIADARRRDVRAEEMLIRLKAEWMPLVDEQGLSWTQRVRELSDRLIAQCISGYYARPGHDGDGSAG